ncbi:MAG: S-layer homology domain-containing protein, partial [Oscillospiraceae bacterium]|nr:S-layer homology domain-containing protein [Oscillospiraceae bacterium]
VNGTGDGKFSPEVTMSRAMFVTVLWRMSGSPAPAAETTFQDLTADWYMESVAWAVEKGIVKGYSDTAFGPNDPVTREQMCVLMIRYLDSLGWTLDKTNPAISFSDADKISDWAKTAVGDCVRMGLINGVGNNMVAPQKDATRMEASTILARFVTAIVEQYCGK